MGIDQLAGLLIEALHRGKGLPIVQPVAGEEIAEPLMLARIEA